MIKLSEVKKAVSKIRNPWFRAKSKYIKYYEKLPIREKTILLESQHGTEISGNIFYILKYLYENDYYQDWDIYIPTWIRHRKKIDMILQSYNLQNVKIVIYASDEYYRLLASAKYLINDNTFSTNFIKKEGQIYLNTWHGTPLKTLGRYISDGLHDIGNAQKNFLMSDYILFPNQQVRDAIMVDYMVDDLVENIGVWGGYPRNTIFFDKVRRQEVQELYNPDNKRIYAYMPTFRGSAKNGGTDKNDIYLKYFLFELDKNLTDDELLYVNLHPVAKKNINFRLFKHIRAFPMHLETYDFLNISDCLITDYSSVFFDFANTRKKIVLFPYDQEEYLANRGMYLDIDTLPFPKVYDIKNLLIELRSPKNYDDSAFRQKYCTYENPQATRQLCEFLFENKYNELKLQKNETNGKKNVLIYVGNLAGNGITASLCNLLSKIDLEKRNYFLTFKASYVAKYKEKLKELPERVRYISIMDDMNLTMADRFIRKLFKKGYIKTPFYMKLMQKRIKQDWLRCFGNAHFDTVIQFNGYEAEVILMWSQFAGNKVIYVHSDMDYEIKVRKNQRRDVLQYAYQNYDKVALITKGIYDKTKNIAKQSENFYISSNIIDNKTVSEKSQLPLEIDDKVTVVYPDTEHLENALQSSNTKIINVGRFSPEKGQIRLLNAYSKTLEQYPDSFLIILGGSSYGNYYNAIKKHVEDLKLEEHVILIRNLPNPFPLLKQCDYFVLSSLYEGFGLVLAEADILGLSVISTDIDGPRTFLQEHGGKLVDNSEEGIYQGMLAMLNGEIKPMNIDYNEYNKQALEEFEKLFD